MTDTQSPPPVTEEKVTEDLVVDEIKDIQTVQQEITDHVTQTLLKDFVKKSDIVDIVKSTMNRINSASVRVNSKPIEIPQEKTREDKAKEVFGNLFDI